MKLIFIIFFINVQLIYSDELNYSSNIIKFQIGKYNFCNGILLSKNILITPYSCISNYYKYKSFILNYIKVLNFHFLNNNQLFFKYVKFINNSHLVLAEIYIFNQHDVFFRITENLTKYTDNTMICGWGYGYYKTENDKKLNIKKNDNLDCIFTQTFKLENNTLTSSKIYKISTLLYLGYLGSPIFILQDNELQMIGLIIDIIETKYWYQIIGEHVTKNIYDLLNKLYF
jgi:hypothetical protein